MREDLPSGTGVINLFGVSLEIIKEFKTLCKGTGRNGRNRSYAEVFEEIWAEWKAFKKTIHKELREGYEVHDLGEARLANAEESSNETRKDRDEKGEPSRSASHPRR